MNRSLPPLVGFSGSYAPEDVTFLLKRVQMRPTPVEEKERRIQTGAAHYSEMISEERRPDARYLDLFEAACGPGVPRLARDVRSLTGQVLDLIRTGRLNKRVTLCSLVRAGVPYGVVLRRDLERSGVDVAHFGVSIIRDRGLDGVAMARVVAERPADGVIFVDGWTGKGAIATELDRSWRELSGRAPLLAVIADPCGGAGLCASREDWLIPSGILGGNVSGLISRSILSKDLIGEGEYHGCLLLDHLAEVDLSRAFVDRVDAALRELVAGRAPCPDVRTEAAGRFRAAADATVRRVVERFGVTNLNRIKPGIAEATRAVLRRRPDRVLVRTAEGDPDLSALLHLCERDQVPVLADPDLTGPYRALTVIRETT
ncbi:cysteine protease StiP domain-containing protein [Nioella nitratireducens]|uniref:cysteine protease StiP domain-containing protein n=1 Tax=Nioella nitratireducens TaxID=1287720 RepID=UPI0008FD363F|nr:cysteine protease StiP domain-containing protein [Nioella nitratireducens]